MELLRTYANHGVQKRFYSGKKAKNTKKMNYPLVLTTNYTQIKNNSPGRCTISSFYYNYFFFFLNWNRPYTRPPRRIL